MVSYKRKKIYTPGAKAKAKNLKGPLMSFKEFYDSFICLNLNQYKNLKVDFEINKFLIIALVGLVAAIIIINYVRSSMYLTVNKLIRHEAIGEENAKTVGELGLNLRRVKRCLASSSQLKTIISRVGEEKLSYEEYIAKCKSKDKTLDKIDFEIAKFYVIKEKTDEARELGLKSKSLVLNTVLFCVLSVVAVVCLIFLMPEILTLVNNIFA